MNISKLEPPNLTGGYIWVYDNDNIKVLPSVLWFA